jgi:O-antigen/teichoic acid export membrane protein
MPDAGSTEPVLAAGVAAPRASSLGRDAIRGSALTMVAFGAASGIRFGASLVLTRLLMPEHFGLMQIVTAIVVGLHLFSDLGVGPNIIQSRRGDDPVFLNTAWTVQVTRGVIVWVAACAMALPLSAFYGQRELVWLVPVASLAAVIGGLESTRLFTQNRKLAFGRVMVVELSSQIVGISVMLWGAWITHSIWALVIGTLTGALVRTALSHLILPGVANRFAWDQEARTALLSFGRWIFVSTAITFLATQSDRLILGKLVSTAQLGIYGTAVNVAVLPGVVISQLSSKVFYPAMASAMRSDTHDPAGIRRTRTRLLLLIAPVIALGIATAPVVLRVLYDSRYAAVGALTPLLLIGTWLGALSTSYGITLLASGRPRFLSLGNAVKTALFVVPVWFVAPRFGVAGVALLVSLAELGLLGISMLGCRSLEVVTWKADLGITAFGSACVLAFVVLQRLALLLGGSPLVGVAAAVIATGAAVALLAPKLR